MKMFFVFVLTISVFSNAFAERKLCNFVVVPPSPDCLVYINSMGNARSAHRNGEWPFGNNTTTTRPIEKDCTSDDTWSIHYVKDPKEAPQIRMAVGANYAVMLECNGEKRTIAEQKAPSSCDEKVRLGGVSPDLNFLFSNNLPHNRNKQGNDKAYSNH